MDQHIFNKIKSNFSGGIKIVNIELYFFQKGGKTAQRKFGR